VWGIDYSHLHRSIQILERYNDRFHWESLITHRFDLDRANEALATVRAGTAIKAVICPKLAAATDTPAVGAGMAPPSG